MKMNNLIKTSVITIICVVLSSTVSAGGMSSTNYAIKWDVADSGGGTSSSTGYRMDMSAGQSSVTGDSYSANYIVVAGFQSVPDSDSDSIREIMDNCTLVPNTDQRDSDVDGFGNICDPDFDNNLVINFTDLGYMKSQFFTADADADLDGNGSVNFTDLGTLKSMFFQSPGPSGIVP